MKVVNWFNHYERFEGRINATENIFIVFCLRILMAIAFVFINTELGQGSYVEKELDQIQSISEFYPIYGVYDYIVKLETRSMDELKDLISYKIRRIEDILSTLTLIVIE